MLRALIVDDDQFAARSLQRSLLRAGFITEIAYSGPEALERLATFEADIVIADFIMPDMYGPQLLTHVRNIAPSAIRVLMSASMSFGAAFTQDSSLAPDTIDFFFDKPWNDKQLVAALLQFHRARGSSGGAAQAKPEEGAPVEPERYLGELRVDDRVQVKEGRFQGFSVSIKFLSPPEAYCVTEVSGQRVEQFIPLRHLRVRDQVPSPPTPPPPAPWEPPALPVRLQMLREAAPEARIELNPPAPDAHLARFESRLGLPVPENFRLLYRTFDGCERDAYTASRSQIYLGISLVPLYDILRLQQAWNRLEKEATSQRFRPGEYWNAGWIPFLEMEDWGLGVIDTVGCFGGTPGQIIQFNHKSGAERNITHASFDAWLLLLIEQLERANFFQHRYPLPPGHRPPLSELAARLNPGHPRRVVLEPVRPPAAP